MPSTGIRQCVRDVTFPLCIAVAISTLGVLQFGFHLAELNAPQDVITCKKQSISTTNLQCIPMTDAQFAIVSSIFTLGGLVGALSGGPISTRFGRIWGMRYTSVAFILGSTCEALGVNIAVLAIGRTLSGIGAGAATVIVPLYISEIAPPQEKGLFGAMTQVTINLGILLAQTLGYLLSYGNKWRIVLAIGAVIGIIQGIGLFVIPESPAWLAAHKQPQLAVQNLQRLRGREYDISAEVDYPEEEEDLLGSRRSSKSSTSVHSIIQIGISKAFSDPLYRPALIAVIGVMSAQQFTGINSIVMYSVSLLSDLLPTSSALLTIIISIVNLFVTIACAPLADAFGRKVCLLLSIAGMGSMSLVLALSIMFSVKILSAISVMLFVASFGVGLGPVPFILASELVGQEAVGATQSAALAANWISTFFVAQFFPIINKALGGRGLVYFIFAGLALGFGAFVALRVPETKGKKDVEEVWGRTRRSD